MPAERMQRAVVERAAVLEVDSFDSDTASLVRTVRRNVDVVRCMERCSRLTYSESDVVQEVVFALDYFVDTEPYWIVLEASLAC